MSRQNWLFLLLLLASLAAYVGLLYFTQRTDFSQLILLFALLFAAYAVLTQRSWAESHFGAALVAALLFRLALLFAWPNLSDDYFRFVWDGRLLVHGINPYLVLPADFIQSPQAAGAGLTQDLYQHLNSPHYYTVYPPVNQAIFALAAGLFPRSLLGSVVVLRLFMLMGEIGTVYLLIRFTRRLQLPRSHVLLYALNPLVIVELTGNLHFEAVMIFFCLAALFGLTNHRTKNRTSWIWSALSLALAVATKLLPLMFLPLFWKRLGFWRGLLYCAVVGLVLLLLFAPFVSQDLIRNFGSSVNLYFQKFEFNASVYYLIREVGFWLKGYNIIGTAGPLLSGISLLATLLLAFQPARFGTLIHPAYGQAALFTWVLFTLSIYYFSATTVHPWYLTTLVAISVLTPYRFPLVWTALLPLTYFAYRTTEYRENLWLVTVEYAFVFGWMIYEIRENRCFHQSIRK
jgi:hypothetical protein